jgi:CubicO group peptidase (beta-lactamase class C family)
MSATSAAEKLGFDQSRLHRITDWMQRYVDDGRFPGSSVLIARHGDIAFTATAGHRDVAGGLPWQRDTLARIYSMTKPVTSVGLMMLYEEARLHLDEPLSSYLPEFTDAVVLRPDAVSLDDVEAARGPITLQHLLTQRSGLSYGFNGGLLGEAYEAQGIDFNPDEGPLEMRVRAAARMPLAFEPGTQWGYSIATDVVGRLIEVISGETLDIYLHNRIFEPLGMDDTGFAVGDDKLDRLASLYVPGSEGGLRLIEDASNSAYRAGKVETFSGGGGLVSTLDDYWRFAEMLRGGGSFGGHRLLSSRTVRLMTSNHLAGDIAAIGPKSFAETSFEGVGFGLGFWVVLDPAAALMSANIGDHGWGGMASTVFWVDPVDDLVVVFLTQLVPSSTYPNRRELRALVQGALVD